MKAGSTSDSVYKKVVYEADAKLQDCFAITDWDMFRDSSDGIEEYTTSVTGFINKCIEGASRVAKWLRALYCSASCATRESGFALSLCRNRL